MREESILAIILKDLPLKTNNTDANTCPLWYRYLLRLGRVAIYTIVIIVLVGLILEWILRSYTTITPQNLSQVGLASTVADPYTAWRNRPNVQGAEPLVTNSYGLHEKREIALKKDTQYRVGVIGSSVALGLGENLDATISYSMNNTFADNGLSDIDVVNFGHHGFNILNVSGYVHAYMHQFEVDAIVLIADLQIVFPKYPFVAPSLTFGNTAVKKLNAYEKIVKRLSEYSCLFTVVDNPLHLKNRINTKSILALLPNIEKRTQDVKVIAKETVEKVVTEEEAHKLEEYRAQRDIELGSHLASLATFCKTRGIRLYVMSPYSPLEFNVKEFRWFANHVVGHIENMFPSRMEAWKYEVKLSTEIINKYAKLYDFTAINPLDQTKENVRSTKNSDFSADGVHLKKEGYLNIGRLIADRMMQDKIFNGREK